MGGQVVSFLIIGLSQSASIVPSAPTVIKKPKCLHQELKQQQEQHQQRLLEHQQHLVLQELPQLLDLMDSPLFLDINPPCSKWQLQEGSSRHKLKLMRLSGS